MTYTVSDYLLDRLAELGIEELFGVPGDFNLFFLDHVLDHERIEWVGNTNELNAGYAADGYARVKGLGALLTTYGVGELSAINATAGSYAERVPVIHIVGAPSLSAQTSHLRMHHTLGDGDFNHFMRMASEVSCSLATLKPATAASDIDRVLRDAVIYRRPGYLMLPADVAVTAATPPAAPLDVNARISSPDIEKEFKAAASEFMRGKKVSVLADIMTDRLGAVDELKQLIQSSGFPFATLMWGKSILNEAHPQFTGIYFGALSQDSTRKTIEDADVLILSGVEFTDSTTAGYSHKIDPLRTINLGAEEAKIGLKSFAPLTLSDALRLLTEVASEAGAKPMEFTSAPSLPELPEANDQPLVQDDLWKLVPAHLDDKNTVVVEMGTSFFGMAHQKFPVESRFIGMPLWGSIGYTLPAMLGAAMADKDSRGVLFIGDGSAQLTIQELATFFRQNLHPVIFLINNDGYTIERSIHGAEADYNDIAPFDWQKIPGAFGATDENSVLLKATTSQELIDACATARETRDKLVFIEIVTAPMDMPQVLVDFGKSAAKANQKN